MRFTSSFESPAFIAIVLIALVLFAGIVPILPAIRSTSVLCYELLLFLFTVSSVILLSFAVMLVATGIQRLYCLIKILLNLRRQRPQ